ncbi:MAG: efflux RND transporter periplasmic adaptor subunit, partial [Acidobacteriota bacterium]|nr:efflux RND transporter periplasmic adaptor subunit [Acidobacteriota bacterium]
LEAARAEQNRACLAADRAKRESERMSRLAEDQIVSVDLLDSAESAYATAAAACESSKAQTARARAALDLARTQIAKTVLKAPFGGIVADLQVELGEWTTPSPPAMPVPPVIDLLDPGSVYISAPMDEVDSAKVQVGQPARVTVDSHRDREFMGKVVRLAPFVLDLQEQNRTLEIEVDLDDQEFASTLLPGTSADVEIILAADDDVLRIPTGALIEGGKVLVLEAGLLEERKLEVGRRNWNFTEVVEGVAAGDKVVVSLDSEEIRDGAEAVVARDEDAENAEQAAD